MILVIPPDAPAAKGSTASTGHWKICVFLRLQQLATAETCPCRGLSGVIRYCLSSSSIDRDLQLATRKPKWSALS